MLELLKEYGVHYVYLGAREHLTYGGDNLAGFAGPSGFLRTAFEQDSVIVYEMVQPTAHKR